MKILEDTDRDGRADKVSIFAEGLNIPTGVAIGYGGVWVLNAPDILFLRAKDGKETSRDVVLTGFGRTDTHELPNSLTWGPDGWLYGLNGVFNQSRVRSNNGREYQFNCALWRVHPRTREFQIVSEGTSNPYGIAWDTEGSAIVEACHWANDHLFHFVETGQYQRQAGAFPPFTIPIGSITDHGHQKTAYCGLTFLDTDAYPPQFRERICVGNIHGRAINVDRLQREGASYLAKGEPDLMTGNDAWFMPVALKIGPDGCLYVLDWYDRYHCSQDAARDPEGVDRLKGRLYRLRYRNTPRAPKVDLASESDDQLIARLASGNIYFRETAQRILTERLGTPGTGRSTALRAKLERLVLAAVAADVEQRSGTGVRRLRWRQPARRSLRPSGRCRRSSGSWAGQLRPWGSQRSVCLDRHLQDLLDDLRDGEVLEDAIIAPLLQQEDGGGEDEEIGGEAGRLGLELLGMADDAGPGAGLGHRVLLHEEAARSGLILAGGEAVFPVVTGPTPIYLDCTPSQREKYLEPLMRGETRPSSRSGSSWIISWKVRIDESGWLVAPKAKPSSS